MANIKTVEQLLQWLKSQSFIEPFDVLVEDQKCQEAISIINRGLLAQAEYLKKRLGSYEEVKEAVVYEMQVRVKYKLRTAHKSGFGKILYAHGHPRYKQQKREAQKELAHRIEESTRRRKLALRASKGL